ncbi:MAG: alanine--glyoxylate aminotransferase family protein [Deltaproteobacteria bacterium]|nr:alanine--glyoxylate aminotransferase family protein [Deltaproteobacteria bacterium]
MVIKKYLMTPGPTPIPSFVNTSMQSLIHHRTGEFREVIYSCRKMLKEYFQTENEVAIFTSSGTGAMEASISNTMCAGDKIVTVEGGKFGERWGKIAKSFGVKNIPLNVEYGDYTRPEDIKRIIDSEKNIKGVYIQASETSTGTFHPIDEIGIMLKKDYPDILYVVDGITAVGVMDMKPDEWGIDMLISGSQKALMLPPGLSFISVSSKARDFMKRAELPHYYFDIKGELSKKDTLFTPAITLFLGLQRSLKYILYEEGLENTIRRHGLLARAVRESVKAMGLELLSKKPADSLTAVISPKDINSSNIVRIMKDECGVQISNGQGDLKGKIFRISHMGYIGKPDIVMAIGALEIALKKLGYHFSLGQGTKSLLEIFSNG